MRKVYQRAGEEVSNASRLVDFLLADQTLEALQVPAAPRSRSETVHRIALCIVSVPDIAWRVLEDLDNT